MADTAQANGARLIPVTFFTDAKAATFQCKDMTLADLRELILNTTAPAKSKLPWLKCAKFGDKKSENGCLRNGDNLIEITGIELDYDAAQMPFEDAVQRMKDANLRALLYTSPSYNGTTVHKWRIICPTSRPLPPTERTKLVARVNGLFGGIFADESFTLSQAYYYGSVNGNPAHQAVLIDGDFIDQRDDLDTTAFYLGGMGDPELVQHERHESDGYLLADDPGMVAAAMAVIPTETEWIRRNRIGMACWAATDGSQEGFVPWDVWLQRSGSYDAGAARDRWRRMSRSQPTRVGFGTLCHLADQADPTWRARYDEVTMTDEKRALDAGFKNGSTT
jgi:Primase C terminal 2 (PriCT-2)